MTETGRAKKGRPEGRQGPREESEEPGGARAAGRSGLLHDLAVQGVVEAVALDFVGDAQADHRLDDGEDDQGDDRVVDDDRARCRCTG